MSQFIQIPIFTRILLCNSVIYLNLPEINTCQLLPSFLFYYASPTRFCSKASFISSLSFHCYSVSFHFEYLIKSCLVRKDNDLSGK